MNWMPFKNLGQNMKQTFRTGTKESRGVAEGARRVRVDKTFSKDEGEG